MILPALLLAASAHTAPVEGRATRSAPAATYGTLDDCLRDKMCWSLTLMAFKELLPKTLSEIEAAEPGRYFPGALAFALERPDKDGHFLRLDCSSGGRTASCADERDKLEQRTLTVNLFRCLPLDHRPQNLYDPKTWELRSAGEEAMAKIKKRHPDVWVRLAKIVRARR